MSYRQLSWLSIVTLVVLVLGLGMVLSHKTSFKTGPNMHRGLTQESVTPPTARIQLLTSTMEYIMATYLLEQGLAMASPQEPSAEQADFLMGLKRDFWEKLNALDPLIAQLPERWQPEYKDEKDMLIFRARMFSRRAAAGPAWAYNSVELISLEDLERILASREHATLIQNAIETFLTCEIAIRSVKTTLEMHLKNQISLEERSTLVEHARASKEAIIALKRAIPSLGLVAELTKRHTFAVSEFEFTQAAGRLTN